MKDARLAWLILRGVAMSGVYLGTSITILGFIAVANGKNGALWPTVQCIGATSVMMFVVVLCWNEFGDE